MTDKEISDFTLKVKRSTAERFRKHGKMGDTTDKLLNRILDYYEEEK
jgi:hypothetical protein